MKIAESNGTKLAYEVAGEGSPVLLVMGLAARARAWDLQFEALSQHHRVVRFDNRGIGKSAPVTGLTSMKQMAADALGLMDHLGWETAHVAGVSMGGMISQELALMARERLRSLSLIATHPGNMLKSIPPVEGLRRFARVHMGPKQHRHRNLARLLFTDAHIEAVGEEHLINRLSENFGTEPPPRATLLAQLGAVLGHNTRRRLAALEGLPTLVIKPTLDLLVPPSGSDALGELIPGARVVSVEGAGHGLMGQVPDEVNGLLLAHLAAVDERGELTAT